MTRLIEIASIESKRANLSLDMPMWYTHGSKGASSMSNKAFEVGDRVRVLENVFHHGPATIDGNTGVVRSVDKDRRRTDPYYIYYVELSGEDRLTDFEYRELELVASASDELKVRD
jgi:hypothetical protein